MYRVYKLSIVSGIIITMRHLLAVAILFWAGVGTSAQAASLYIDLADSSLQLGDVAVLQVRLDTDEAEQECINTVSGAVDVTGPVDVVDTSIGSSIVNLWLESPVIETTNAGQKVRFTAGIPNGYCGRIEGDPRVTNVLFEIVVRAATELTDVATATVSFQPETVAYQNDGFGTAASLTTYPISIAVSDTFGAEIVDPWTDRVISDTVPPRQFSIELVQDGETYSGRYYITFNTTDKETGIDRYEILEEPLSDVEAFLWGGADAPWKDVSSPFVLEDQSLSSIIRVKAIDKAGNEYIANLIPDKEIQSVSKNRLTLYLVFGLLLFILVVAGYWYWRLRYLVHQENRIRAQRTNNHNESEIEYNEVAKNHEHDQGQENYDQDK